MYVTTFYSFKGGVGRTMALVNTAVELANRGRRVLAVDFDLEAPGLDSFGILRPEKQTRGLIDFVREYRETGEAPDATEFTYRAPKVGKQGGGLWIMPAGAARKDYGVRFRDVDWAELYAHYDGYLLFEDLKAQWEKNLRADWVFVDSRTGHTDTGGICTRQLPDAVVVVFFPNEQNLRGLTEVVREIRAEADTAREKRIELHFVMSNVPDLDDEDEILRKQTLAFREKLAMKGHPVIVHRYDSLALLNQAIFIQERPRSRLAREYREVAQKIVSANLEDRDGALLYVEKSRRRPWRIRGVGREPVQERQEKLKRIEETHASDAELLYEVARLYEAQRSVDDVARLFDRAIEAGSTEPEALLFRSRIRAEAEDPEGATEDAMGVLQTDAAHLGQVAEALRLAALPVETLMDTVAVRALDPPERSWVGAELAQRNEHPKGIAMLESFQPAELPEDLRWNAQHLLSLMYLASGRCQDAATLLGKGGVDVSEMKIIDAFNYGMALWGTTGVPKPEPFRRVLALSPERKDPKGCDFLQCLAVAHWAAGDDAAAMENLTASTDALEEWSGRSLMSCWRYEHVSRKEFRQDLKEIEAFIAGDSARRPRFMTDPR